MTRRWRGPAEGWASLILLVFLAFLVGFAVDDARWVLGRNRLTDFLPGAAILGTLVGFATAQLGWGRLRAHLATAIAAALVVPVLVGSALQPDQGDVFSLYRATADSSLSAFTDLVVRGHGSTLQYGHYMLVLGLLVWATGHFAAYAVYRHHRPFSAVVALGLALVVNMSLTTNEQLPILVMFSVAALLLLVGLHAFDERREWLRRRIGDPGPLSSLTLRGGTTFVIAAVLGSLVLTTTASSAPLRDAWIGAEPTLIDIGRQLQQLFPFLSSPRGPAGVEFGSTASIAATWTTNQDVAVVIHRPANDPTPYYWRAATYDQFLGYSWIASDSTSVPRAAGNDLLKGSAEGADVKLAVRRNVTVTVDPQGYRGAELLAPTTPVSVDVGTRVSLIGAGGYVASIAGPGGAASYTVSSLYPTFGDKDAKAITENKLRVAGTDYPASIAPYLVKYPLGPASQALLAKIRSQVAANDPYDWATAAVAELRSDDFHYTTDVSGLDCASLSAVECFARYKRGFCQYYASTMVVLLRQQGIPTRLVQGFLPGDLVGSTETILNSRSHAWVEIWFPGYGWVDFDPTGAVAELQPIAPGAPVATPSATPAASRSPGDGGANADPTRGRQSVAPNGGGTTIPGDPGSAPFIIVALLLGGAMVWLAFSAYRRGPREVTADGAWSSVTRMARRLGFGPRPTQTVYEYSSALGDLLPTVRPELETVARAKVEVAYGHHALGEERIRALRIATGRLRVNLLRLAVRRPRRRR
ncbi:MAG TPA: transglutaminase domain-containing protein [Candidatus Dormibacteraeota bacterium]|nr:transglutaminase domain-containing protein [Candidatus Dormibacteraeota bacterium]